MPVATYMEKLLVDIFRAFTFLCFFGSLTFTHFASVVVPSRIVLWIQAINGEIAQAVQKYYSTLLGEGEGTLLEDQEAYEAVFPVLHSVMPDPGGREKEKEASEVANPILLSVVPDPEDKEREMEVIETNNIEATHHPNNLVQLRGLPVIETEHTKPAVAAIDGREFAKAKKPTRASMNGLDLQETMVIFTSGTIPAVSVR